MYQQFYETVYQIIQQQKNKPRTNWGVISSTLSLIGNTYTHTHTHTLYRLKAYYIKREIK